MKRNLYPPQSGKVYRITLYRLILAFLVLSLTLLKHDNLSDNNALPFKYSIDEINHPSIKSLDLNTLRFEKNLGQAGKDVDFLFRNGNFSITLFENEVIISSDRLASNGVRMQLPGSNKVIRSKGINKLRSVTNYLIGNDPEKWITQIPNYEKVKYSEVYPGIDLVYHGKEDELEFDFEVSPGKDPGAIKIKFPAEHNATLKENGDIILTANPDPVIITRPIAYQNINGMRKQIEASFVEEGNNSFGFQLEKYNSSIPLIIDPVVSFATLLSGGAQEGNDLAIDINGFVYVTGGSSDVYVAKFHPEDDEFIYTTFFGSSDDDNGNAIAIDNEGCAYITGETRFDDFPLKNALQEDFGGAKWVDGDAFVTKLNPTGDTILFSTYLGGEIEDIGHDIQLDFSGNIVLAGETNSYDFPRHKAYQNDLKNGEHEAFITKIKADLSGYVFSTFLGGSSDDVCYALDLDQEGNIYITGSTWSQDFYTTENAFIKTGVSANAFVTKMNPTGDNIIFSTYLTGSYNPDISGVDLGTGIAVSETGEVYVAGETYASNFPVLNAAQNEHGGQKDGFIVKLNSEGSGLLYSTFIGGSGSEIGLKIHVDNAGKAYITGQTNSSDFPVKNPLKNSLGGILDAFILVLEPDGKSTEFSTYYGGDGYDYAKNIALNNKDLYITGYTYSEDLNLVSPLTNTTLGGFVTRISFESAELTWKEVTSNYSLPSGIKLFEGTRLSPALKAYYIDADLNRPELSIRPYIRGSKLPVHRFNEKTGAYVSVNGGFFSGNISNSAVIYPNDLKAKNVKALTRNSKAYPVIRSLFGMKKDKSFSVDWIYHFGNYIDETFIFSNPLDYSANDPNPRPVPSPDAGTPYSDLLIGIGGGPVLIKDGAIKITFNEEIFWDAGVGYSSLAPRTAVGYTSGKHVIMLVVDGRSDESVGVGLPELAGMMKDLGCVEALNLDGGGSSQMATGNTFINTPSEIRYVPSILSIVHKDSLNISNAPVIDLYYSLDDENIEITGDLWSGTSLPGSFGDAKALEIPAGNGNNYVDYKISALHQGEYEIYAWYVSAPDRCTDTPYIISHQDGTDTVRVNQTVGGSFWQIIGNYSFTGNNSEYVRITDGGSNGIICADAIRIVSEERIATSRDNYNASPVEFELSQNYPNPFHTTTSINYSLNKEQFIELSIFDFSGRNIRTLIRETNPAGDYKVIWNGKDNKGNLVSDGIYVYKLSNGSESIAKSLILLRD